MVGLFQGGVQALSRSYFGRIIPKEKSNEYYGFFDIFGRYASVMGTFLVSVVTSLTGNPSLERPFYWRAADRWLYAAGSPVPHDSGSRACR
ncbi:MAG: MFS transporter [Collinsella sp.]